MTLLPLITRLEAASGLSQQRYLIVEVAETLVQNDASFIARIELLCLCLAYESAVIAIAERVLPGLRWLVRDDSTAMAKGGLANVYDYERPEDISYPTRASTPALALCIAILRAVSEQKPPSPSTSP